ncbi:hypothetical protein E2C01_051972 [Portunus trituberculatus]|uniref:Uncharacterized protein n=1 Tax=Portunus trituberculatus TaxID=210409 RepID=A0A5B7GCE6_PORTR|nr:hypothetical protein [Portunus trituberculatus]
MLLGFYGLKGILFGVPPISKPTRKALYLYLNISIRNSVIVMYIDDDDEGSEKNVFEKIIAVL